MKTLHQIAIENLNEAITRLGENTRRLTIATITNDRNALIKLTFEKNNLEQEINYHRSKLIH